MRAEPNNPWVRRASARELAPHTEDEEQAMLRKALELSQQTAEVEEMSRRY